MSVIEFKPKAPRLHSIKKKSRDYNKPYCEHRALEIDEARGVVICKNEKCAVELSPMQALMTFAQSLWHEEYSRERDIEYQAKRVAKIQYAAIAHLYEAGVTPDRYAERWAKEDARRKEIEIKAKAKENSLEMPTPIGAA